jgi:galactonate dehydratase
VLRSSAARFDRLPWDEELFTMAPQFEKGHLVVPTTPGWGTEPVEEAIHAHPSKAPGGLLHYLHSWAARRCAGSLKRRGSELAAGA